MCVKERLDKALNNKTIIIKQKKRKEELERAQLEKDPKKQKDKNNRKIYGGIKKKMKTWHEEELALHEAYQFILKEHHTRVKRRVKQKISAVSLLKNLTLTPKPGVLQGITAENNDVKTSENANAKSNNVSEKQGIFPRHINNTYCAAYF